MANKTGWNSLTPQQQADWKKKNFNLKVKVTQSQLDKLRKAGTPTKAINLYKDDKSMREALNRFYGKDKVAKIAGKSTTKPSTGGTTKPKGNGTTKPSTKVQQSYKPKTRGALRGPASVDIKHEIKKAQSAIKAGNTPEGQQKTSQAINTALLIASFLPLVGSAARIGRTAMVAKRAQTTYKNAKLIQQADKLRKAGKPLPITSKPTKVGGRHQKPLPPGKRVKPSTPGKRVTPGTKPKVGLSGGGKRVGAKSPLVKSGGRHVGPRKPVIVGKGGRKATKPLIKKSSRSK